MSVNDHLLKKDNLLQHWTILKEFGIFISRPYISKTARQEMKRESLIKTVLPSHFQK